MEDSPRLLKQFLSLNVRTYGYVFRDTNGPNPRHTLKIPGSFASDIFMFTRWRKFEEASCGTLWETVPIGNACSFIKNLCSSYQYVWMTSTWLDRSREPTTKAWSPWAKGGAVRREGDEIRLAAVLDQVVFDWNELFHDPATLEDKLIVNDGSKLFMSDPS